MKTLFLLCFTMISYSLFAQNDADFTGVFENTQTGIVLSMSQKNGRFEGLFTVQNQRFTCVAVHVDGGIGGTYRDGNRNVEFSLLRLLGEYFVHTEGVNIPMKRVSQVTSPSAGSSSTATTTNVPPPSGKSTGTQLRDANVGYAFNAPAGWQVKQENGNYGFTRAGEDVVLAVVPHGYNSVQTIMASHQDANDPKNNTYLKASKQTYGSQGAWLGWDGTANGQAVSLQTIALVSPYGGGVSVLLIAPKNVYRAEHRTILQSIANSVTFTKPQVSPLAEQWKSRIAGRQLLYFYTASGFSEKQSYDFCSDGTFAMNVDNSASSSDFGGSFSAATQGGNAGTWRVVAQGNQAVLMLMLRDGGTRQFTLANTSNGVGMLLNGKKFLSQASSRCR
ncbi:hypothetical protein [Runella zeae]|uniref:hypothetical protein n=1 Tax=Runella zeae TaxID=94255 RepID=UPI00041D0E7A|nr:hypothetical protein [Runella zeae]